MREELKQWRDLSKEDKSRLMTDHKIKVVTFDFIKSIYKEPERKPEPINLDSI